jgi:hypothetical protein
VHIVAWRCCILMLLHIGVSRPKHMQEVMILLHIFCWRWRWRSILLWRTSWCFFLLPFICLEHAVASCRVLMQQVNIFLQPGFYAVGASMLQPVYNSHAPGNWNAHYEAVYRRQARFMIRLQSVASPLLSYMAAGQIPQLHDMPKMLNWIDGFRLARLCAFFRCDPPGLGFRRQRLAFRLGRQCIFSRCDPSDPNLQQASNPRWRVV